MDLFFLLLRLDDQGEFLHRPRDGVQEDVGRDGLAEKIVRAALQRFDDRIERRIGGEEGEGQERVFSQGVIEKGESALPAHAEVREDDDLSPVPGEDSGRSCASCGLQNRVAGLLENGGVLRQIPRVRIDDEDGRRFHGGCILPRRYGKMTPVHFLDDRQWEKIGGGAGNLH